MADRTDAAEPSRAITRLLRAPAYADVARTRQARLIHTFAVGYLAISTLALLVTIVLQPELSELALGAVARLAFLYVSVVVLNKTGFQRAATVVFLVGSAFSIAITAFNTGGIRSTGMQHFVVLTFMAALLFGYRAAVLAGVSCLVITLALAAGEAAGHVPPSRVEYNVWVLWVLNARYVAFFMLALHTSTRALMEALSRAEAELALRRVAERKLELALESGKIGVWEQDPRTGDYLGDRRGFDLFRFPMPADRRFPFDTWKQMVDPADRPRVLAALGGLQSGDTDVRVGYGVTLEGGARRHVEVTASALLDEGGRPNGVVGLIADVTERREAELERERLVADLGERVKELGLLHFASRRLEGGGPLDREFLQPLVDAMPGAWMHTDCCEARITYGDIVVATSGWRESPWSQSASFASSDARGRIEIVYLQERPPRAEGPFLAEERSLLQSLAEMLESHVERHVAARRLDEARNRLLASEAVLRAAFSATPAMVVISDVDDDGRFIEVNDAFESITGHRRDQAIGRTSAELGFYRDPAARDEVVRRIQADGRVRDFEFPLLRKDGSSGISLLNVDTFSAGDRRYAVSVGVDVTEKKKAEQELERHRRHLEELVEERTEELRNALHAADAASRAKGRFLANMSHEIRTPMNAVLGFAQLLLRDPAATPEQRRRLETINRAGDHLMSLIDDVLQLAKVEAGRETLSESAFDLWALVDDLDMLFRPRAFAKGLLLAVERDPSVPRVVRADPGKLRQVVSNLLGNAVKFTASGRVVLRIALLGEEGRRRLAVEVEDTGPGISPDELPRLFEKFEQTAAGRTSGQGTGLGLAISRDLVRLMGGEIGVRGRPGAGCVFHFDVPVAEAAVADAPQRPPITRVVRLAPGQSACRVLVADDVEDNRTFLHDLLTAVGFEVRACADGAEAVRAFAEWAPDLVLMDAVMPVLDGVEAIRRIRCAPGGSAVKILCVTASVFDDDVRTALDAGADGFLNKPLREDVLLERVGSLLGVRYDDAPASPADAPGEPTADAVARIPAELRRDLRRATVSGDLDAMFAVIDRTRPHGAETAGSLRGMAERFEYARITHLMDEPAACEETVRT